MQFNFELINVLIFLFPGLIAVSIYDTIVSVKKVDGIKWITKAFIFSFSIYLISYFSFNISPVSLHEKVINSETIYSINISGKSMLLITGISIILPLLIAFIINNDYLTKLLRKVNITTKTSRISTWTDVMLDIQKHVTINFKDGKMLYGWIMYHSPYGKDENMYIYKPSWIEDGEYIDLQIHGILIYTEDIESIYFLDN